ncbi:putative cation exchanger C521.04c [Aplysia californica]|uniref:Cation exchanger C521.04c n=1 Tax=Aplysia californica TaxID=6500 RepID=A0ABM1AB43_APLCA|nr:putative cation exchanger C521.04c [Aplysia californica]
MMDIGASADADERNNDTETTIIIEDGTEGEATTHNGHVTPQGDKNHQHQHHNHHHQGAARKRGAGGSGGGGVTSSGRHNKSGVLLETETGESGDFHMVDQAENEVEARKIYNNYKFGLRIWKSHVSSRDLSTRSEIVQSLYSDVSKYQPVSVKVSTLRVSNVIYCVLAGSWLSLLYLILGALMYATVIGKDYGLLCFRLAKYFFWPFGKFVHQYHQVSLQSVARSLSTGLSKTPEESGSGQNNQETSMLLGDPTYVTRTSKWKKVQTYVWLVFAVPLLLIAHGVVFAISWFLVVSIPIAKINSRTITKILFTSPDEIRVGDSGHGFMESGSRHSEIIMYTHQSFNFYYYKYTVDGVNVILANLLIFVILSIALGYADEENEIISPVAKCILSILAILPVTYYIGMAITSISAVSSFAVGAILNATFGSMVEVILFIIMLKKGKDSGQTCYEELVKSTLTGSILCCVLLVPGMSMVIGGLKYRRQHFNPKSANISSSLLFVAIIGVFAPTIFSKIYGNLECDRCEQHTPYNSSVTNATGFLCSGCKTVVEGLDHSTSLYSAHVEPLVYACALILPIAYLIGLIFSMKTHTADIFEDFENQQKEEGAGGHHGSAQWSRIKSGIILLVSATAIALCADLISINIPPLLNTVGISEYFMGVTLLSIVSMLPELVNGVQFALQNNVNLGIEIGSAAAIQVCMVQLPIIVLADLIYPMGFNAVFNDIHLWAVIFAIIIINYIFQDGKSNYFQGSIVMFIYILLMAMYFFTVTPPGAICRTE